MTNHDADTISIFEYMYPTYKLPNKVRLFESFSGIGCQRMGFERAGIDYKVVGISEIDKYALKSYEAMHGECPNFGSITDISGKNIPQIDVFTYSFPCTDLSKAGQQKGMTKDTRSGLVFEVLRILWEAKEANNLPKVLIMENVVDLVQAKFIRQFQEIQLELEQIGYRNYTFKMNAKDYGIAQNRDRVFMVSILGEHYYGFPKPIKLEKRLKDYLDKEVDEKYYLSDAMLNYCTDMTDRNGFVRGLRFNPQEKDANYAFAITTNPGSRPVDNFIIEENKKIRKLTPQECWRLMGIDYNYFDKASQVCSNAQLYKQAGNGIVVDVMASILKQMKQEDFMKREEIEKKIKYTYYEIQCTKSPMRIKDLKRHIEKLKRMLNEID